MSEDLLRENAGSEVAGSDSSPHGEEPLVGTEFLSGLGGRSAAAEEKGNGSKGEGSGERAREGKRLALRGRRGVLLAVLFLLLAFAVAGGAGYWWFFIREKPKAMPRGGLGSGGIFAGVSASSVAPGTVSPKGSPATGRGTDVRTHAASLTGNGAERKESQSARRLTRDAASGRVASRELKASRGKKTMRAGSTGAFRVSGGVDEEAGKGTPGMFGGLFAGVAAGEDNGTGVGAGTDERLVNPLDRLFLSWAAEKRILEEMKRREQEEAMRRRSCEEEIQKRLAQIVIQNPKPLREAKPKPRVKLSPIRVYGVTCAGSDCRAFTDWGVLRPGDRIGDRERVIEVSPDRIVTDYRVIEF